MADRARTIVIEVRGGAVAEVYSDATDTSVLIVDWDDIEAGGSAGPYPVTPLESMPAETSAQLSTADNPQ